jgi:hypothetical protein
MYLHLNIHNLSTHSHPSEEENRSRICKCKRAFATEWQCTIDLFVKRRVLPHKLMIVKKYNQWCSKGLIFFFGGGQQRSKHKCWSEVRGVVGLGQDPPKNFEI